MSAGGASSEQACISLKPVQVNYVPLGHWLDEGLGGLKTYVSRLGKSKKAILYIYDIGGYCSQNYQGADLLASTGLHIFIPDMFRGNNLDLPKLTSMPKDEADEVRSVFRAGAGNIDAAIPVIQGMVEELRGMGYEKIAGAGFCWGGVLVSLTPSLDAHAIIHPGAQVDESAAKGLVNPTCLLPSMHEDEGKVRVVELPNVLVAEGLLMEAFHKVMLSKPCADRCLLKWYKDMPHGWCSARADLGSERGREQFRDAFETLAGFFAALL